MVAEVVTKKLQSYLYSNHINAFFVLFFYQAEQFTPHAAARHAAMPVHRRNKS